MTSQKCGNILMLTYHKPFSKNSFNFARDDLPIKDFSCDVVFSKVLIISKQIKLLMYAKQNEYKHGNIFYW